MDFSTADVPANVVHDSPGKDSSSSDDVPLSKLLTRPRSEEKREHTHSLTVSSDTKSKQDKSALDDSSDDEPLIKIKSAQTKKPVKKDNVSPRSNGTNNKKADLNADDSSDDEPLIKIAKMSSKPSKKPLSAPPKKSDESLDSDDDSDDAPLSKLAGKLHSKRQRKAPAVLSRKTTPVIKSKRNAARKKVKYAESSSESSDHETLAAMKKRLTKAPKEQKTSANSRKTKAKRKDKSLKDPSTSDSSSDDDVPLVNLVAKKKKPVKKNTKTTSESKGRARKRRGDSHESSDDEPLIDVVKKKRTDKQMETKTMAPALEKRDTAAKKPRKTLVSGSSSNSSDDEPLIKAAKHPQVTKILRIILERCDCEEAGATRSLEKTSTDTPTAEKTSSEELEDSPEEE
ncbi:nucleolar protein dao-5-like isoform X2 [Pempheris klunzingeri]|uniref:nucleolar protein dao-5-like isoform X2 n=1 Tax=Pempheris klunzingeri TaxID=3127111 RepID=UPI00397EC79D